MNIWEAIILFSSIKVLIDVISTFPWKSDMFIAVVMGSSMSFFFEKKVKLCHYLLTKRA